MDDGMSSIMLGHVWRLGGGSKMGRERRKCLTVEVRVLRCKGRSIRTSIQREVRTLEKLQKMQLPDSKELMQASSPQTKEGRLSKLDEDYQALELRYSCTIERLAVK